MLIVPPTQEGLNSTIADTGRSSKPSKRKLDLSRRLSMSSSILRVAT